MGYQSDYYDNDNHDPQANDMRNGGRCPIHIDDETHWTGVEEEEEAGLAWCPSCQAVVKFIPSNEPDENPYERSGAGRGFW